MKIKIDGKKAKSIVAIVWVLAMSVGAPMLLYSSPVHAQSTSDGWQEKVGETACAAGGLVSLLAPQCTVEYGDVDGATASQVHWDIFADATLMQDKREQVIEEKMSLISQTEGIALAQAKKEIISCMNNGNAKAVCVDQAITKADENFATFQKSIMVSQNRQMQHWKLMHQQIGNTDNLSYGVYSRLYNSTYTTYREANFKVIEVQLYNGETVKVMTGYFKTYNQDIVESYYIEPYYYDGQHGIRSVYGIDMSASDNYRNDAVVNVVSPDGSGETVIALDGSSYKTALTKLDTARTNTINAIPKMADSIYANYDPGEITVSDSMGPLETIVTSSTNDNPLTYRLKSAALSGYAVNDDGRTVKVKADFNDDGTIGSGETKSGVIYADSSVFPSNTVKTGTTYLHTTDSKTSTVTVSGDVMFISTPDGSSPKTYTLDGKFTVMQVYDSKGNKVGQMTLSDNKFTTTDTTQLNSQMSEINNKLQKLEESYNANSASLGGLSGITSGITSFFTEFGKLLLLIGGGLVALWYFK